MTSKSNDPKKDISTKGTESQVHAENVEAESIINIGNNAKFKGPVIFGGIKNKIIQGTIRNVRGKRPKKERGN